MPLESGDFISDLVETNPPGTDNVSQGDDHLRLIKHVLKTQFPNLTCAVTATCEDLNNAGKSTMPKVTTYTSVAAAQTHTFEVGRSWYKVIVTGGGAGGQDLGGGESSGGGGGATVIKTIPIVAATATYTVGAGGASGGAGEASSFVDDTDALTAGGGITDGTGGTATGGDINVMGGIGSNDDAGGSYWASSHSRHFVDPSTLPGLYGVAGSGDRPTGGGRTAGWPGIIYIEEY